MRLLVLLCLLPTVAFGAGFYISENGTKTLMMGGAFAGQADDLSAIQHNPAGLAQLQGFHFLLDGQLVFHDITFQRYDPGFDPANPPKTPVQPVSNTGGPFTVPMIGVGYGFKLFDRNLMIALGVYGPPSDGHYQYPTPDYSQNANGTFVNNPDKYAPQRYSLISNSILLVFPTLSIAYAIHPRVMLGVSLQPVLASFSFSQSVTSFPGTPTSMTAENPSFDSVVNVNLPLQLAGFTAIGGVLVRPIDMLSIGVSFRPPVAVNAKGKLGIDLGPTATQLGAKVTGDDASLALTLPMELKVGVHVQPISRLGINADFVYQGWQSVQEILLTPNNVSLALGGAPTAIAPFHIKKGWNASYQFRLGASFRVLSFLTLYLGGWYETGAIPVDNIGVDFLAFERFFVTGGVGFNLGPIEILAGAAGSPKSTHAVTSSTALAANTDPTVAGDPVGAGVYTSMNYMFTLGVRGHFDLGPKPKPPPEPAPVPVLEQPAPETAPGPDAAPVPTTTTENPTP